MSKLNQTALVEAIAAIIEDSQGKDKKKFAQTVDLQIRLKGYDTSKDKRFSGNIRLPNNARPGMKLCILADAFHEPLAAKAGLAKMNVEDLKRFNKDKKKIKKMCQSYSAFLASDTLIRQIPKLLGPQMSRAGKFPAAVTQSDDLADKVQELKSSVKFQLKKVLTLATAVGNVEMEAEQLRANIMLALNFLVSLLKKNWQNLKSVSIKSTMGKPHKIY